MDLNEFDFRRITDYMLTNYGINLENKSTLINGRLSNLVLRSDFKSIHEYVEYALNDRTGEELSRLVSKLTTNYTFFMREPQHYDYLEKIVLPELLEKSSFGDVKLWSAGCSSGEEPYSIAMAVKSILESRNSKWTAEILATDISDKVLQLARAAAYEEMQLKMLGPEVRKKYFTVLPDGTFQVSEDLRKMVRLEKFNLMNDFSRYYHKFDIIFCRNVMIYFKNDKREELVRRFYDALKPGGYLFVGSSETLHGVEARFKFVKPAIYRRL